MPFPLNKTKIVCTIGPASESPDIMEQMIRSGMDVARLNFSHGDFEQHATVIGNLKKASQATGKRIAIMADLPGPKMRIGKLLKEPIELRPGDLFTLTTEEGVSSDNRVSVTFPRLTQAVKIGDILFLNDGLIQMKAVDVNSANVRCKVTVGGELRSKKGLNIPGIDLGINAFTDYDHKCLKFALEHGVDAVSQSFVEKASDIEAVRNAAAKLGYNPFIIAKIERSRALDYIEEIFSASDGIMIARGDLGVELPIEQIAVVQKRLMRLANVYAKPVITATQMLESMTQSPRPTRAESTDVANAILDGTDCVMLSAESAMGSYPIEAVQMLAKIAATIEPHRRQITVKDMSQGAAINGATGSAHLIAAGVEASIEYVSPAAVFVPSRSGDTARSIARFRIPVWIVAISSQEAICKALQFSYGVFPVHEAENPDNWNSYVKNWLYKHGVEGKLVVLTMGPSARHPDANHRIEILDLDGNKDLIARR
ncbi:MAG: pyruvate kinase [Nitrospirae bacterium]|nr:pyruvate kinase [Nitrospirota bacterium]